MIMSDTDIEFETPCDICDGKGGSFSEYPRQWFPCHACNGSGYQTTKIGEKVLRLMRHNFRLMFERMQNGDD
jgi:DnaJ-class molecular chaperone